MNTNKFFSFNRCWLLLRNDVMINHKKYLLTMLGAFIVGYVILYLKMPKVQGEAVQNDVRVFLFGGRDYRNLFSIYLLALGAFVGLAFPQLTSKVSANNYLLIPASTFEKFTVQFLIRIVAGISIFLTLFWLAAYLARFSALSVFKGDSAYAIQPFSYSIKFWKGGLTFDNLAIDFLIFSTGTFLFSVRIFFKRLALVKTIISLAALVYAGVCVMVLFTHIFYPSTIGFKVHFDDYVINAISSSNFKIRNIDIFVYSISFLSWLFILPLGYYKLKEKEL